MRKINDIVPPSLRKDSRPLSNESSSRESQNTFPYKTLITVVLIVAASFAALSYFSTAKVEVTANTVSAAVQGPFTASKTTGDLPYEIITAQKIASQSVKGTGTKTVNSFASGTITIYNAQSKSQKLITNTRFATTDGLIFRIRQAVTVPGGTATKPGSVQAKVYADKAGDSYNIAATSFTIPGFAGTPLAEKIYARSSAAMTGGASGTVPVVDAASEAQAQMALIKALEPELKTALENQIPSGYILIPGSATTTFQELTPEVGATAGQVDIKEQGTISAVVFPNTALAKTIAASVTALGYQGEPVSLLEGTKLELIMAQFPSLEADSFSFTLAGTAQLGYVIDPTRIAAAVAGKTRAAAEVALGNYPEIKRAFIVLRPFWRQEFPQDPASITVTEVKP